MLNQRLLIASLLAANLVVLSACNNDKDSHNPAPKPTPTNSIEAEAKVSSKTAKVAVFGDVSSDKFSEKKLSTTQTALLLDDAETKSYGFAVDSESIKSLPETSQDYLSKFTALLIENNMGSNVLVNKTSKNAESEVVNITLDVDAENNQSLDQLRDLLLNSLNQPTTNALFQTRASVTATQKIRLQLSLWKSVASNTIFIWVNVYPETNSSQVQKTYGDLDLATALASLSPQLIVTSTSNEFTQNATGSNAVDILWNIDASGSMSEEQTNLANGASQFFTALNQANINYRLAVNTHDASRCKTLRKTSTGAEFIDPQTANAETEWQTLARPGTWESGTETGFFCVREANLNNFDRPNAKNLVVFVSDEPENETYSQQTPAGATAARDFNDYKDFFLQQNTTYFSIVGTAEQLRPTFASPAPGYNDSKFSCSGQGGYAEGGAHFKEISRLTGGSSASICADANSWSVMFDEIINAATGLASQFTLTQIPIPSSVTVKVNEKSIVRDTTHQNGFDIIYSNTGASLVFYGTAVPKANDKIKVSYKFLARN